jgi:release factor glutamine methyltransferase
MTNVYSIKTTLSLTAVQLKAQRIDAESAKLEAQLLLQHALNVNRAWLIAHADDVLNGLQLANFNALFERRLNGEPIAYILGYREFYGLNFKVSPDTLIPRPDTETLVDAALAKIALKKDLSICDLGTGTGAIALAIAKNRPNAMVTALDASQAALDIAIENAQQLNISNVRFLLSDWFLALNQQNSPLKFDVIVSNPPYIEQNDVHLKQGDLRFEPLRALASGADGLDDIRHIISQAPQHLNPHGWLLLEHGYNQAERVATLLSQAGFNAISHSKDLAGINRVTLGQLA